MGKATIAVALIVVLLIGYYAGQPGNLTKLENYVSSGAKHLSGGSSSINNGNPLVSSSTVSTTSTHVGGYSATPVETIWGAYDSNAASGAAEYGGRTMLVDGSVDDVEQASGGGYQSCILASSDGSVYGCQLAQIEGGDIIWNWASQAAAAKVPFGITIVATCMVAGLQQGNLVLNDCTIYDVPAQDQAAQQESYCSALTGNVSVSDLVIIAPKGLLTAHNDNANITMTVSNKNAFPVGLASATASLGYTNEPPIMVGIYTEALVNASSQLSMKLEIAQGTDESVANAVLAGQTLELTLEFGEGQSNGAGGYGISNPCPITVSGTAVSESTSTTTTD